MKKWIERALNIHSGDLGRGTLLCACLFLVITSYVIGKVAGAALFLSRFQAKQLAYADISSSLIVVLVVAGYVLVARRVTLQGSADRQHLIFRQQLHDILGTGPLSTRIWPGCFRCSTSG